MEAFFSILSGPINPLVCISAGLVMGLCSLVPISVHKRRIGAGLVRINVGLVRISAD